MNIPKYEEILRSELTRRFYAKSTKDTYCCTLKQFLLSFDVTEPHKITNKDILRHFTYIAERGQTSYFNQLLGALKIFYPLIGQHQKPKGIKRPRKKEFFPIILNESEVVAIIKEAKNLKHKAILTLLYACGLRVSEAINLKIEDINGTTVLIRNSKGNKSRIVPLDKYTLSLLREYWKAFKPKEYLFNGQFKPQYTATSIRNFLKKYVKQAGVTKKVYPHLLRHTSLTHYLEGGTDIRVIQAIAGHKSPNTTAHYAHVSPVFISQQKTPVTTILEKALLLE